MRYKKFLALAALFSLFSANAMDVAVENTTQETVVLAFSYLDKDQDKWMVDGWYNIKPKETSHINLNTNNELYYLYAEFSNGKKIEGGKDSLRLKVRSKSFIYPQDDKSFVGYEVNFLKARGVGDKAQIKIN